MTHLPQIDNIPQKGVIELSNRCRIVYLKDRKEYALRLYWKGKEYHRGHYDNRLRLIYKKLAERLQSAINQDIDDKGEDFDPRMWFVSDRELQFSYAVDEWYKTKEYAPGTIRNVESAIARAKEYFGDTNIKTIRKAHIKKFVDTLPQSPNTKRAILSYLKSALNDICDDWHLMRIPFPFITIPYSEQKWLKREQQDKLINLIPDYNYPIFRLMQAYGCRTSEACALMWDCVDWEERTVFFKRTFSAQTILRETTKTGYYRKVPLTDNIIILLRPLRLDISNQFVFKNLLGEPYRQQTVWQIWNRILKRNDIEHISVKNAFRHSKVSQLEEAGYSLEERQRFMGHRNPNTTQIYSHKDVQELKGMVG